MIAATVLLLCAAGARQDRLDPVTVHSTIGDLLGHPAFAGFARLILPWDDRELDGSLPISRIRSILPYHTHVDPETVARALNRMVDDIRNGRQVFYRFYPQAAIQREPGLKNTGLFFFRGRPGAPFAVVCPGGGFAYVACLHEGFPYAEAISSRGFHAFVLKYRAGQGATAATEDLAMALRFLFANASSLGIATEGYSLWGSSAGARMAATIGSHGAARYGGGNIPRPSAVVIAYTAHSDYTAADPPTFAVAGENDAIAPPAVMEKRVEALRRAGVPVEYRRYPGVGHGFGPGVGTSAEGWLFEALQFWDRHRSARAGQP